jgi:hypothetical protein
MAITLVTHHSYQYYKLQLLNDMSPTNKMGLSNKNLPLFIHKLPIATAVSIVTSSLIPLTFI